MWLYIILNIISMVCWTVLAITFDKWWIALFALLFMLIPTKKTIKKYYRICDKCGKHSPYANTYNKAIDNAKKAGWITTNNEGKTEDYCPDCQ